MANFQLKIGSVAIPAKEELRGLGLLTHQSGSGIYWLRKVHKDSTTTLHLIRRIATHSGGARTETDRRLVRAVLQPRLLYHAQFHRLSVQQWAQLETINREAMRSVTALPRLTPILILQEHAQLNTTTELIKEREEARKLKRFYIPMVAAIHSYL